MEHDVSRLTMSDFLGLWTFDREVSGPSGGQMRGQAKFTGHDPTSYVETGVLTLLSGAQFPFERAYLWQFDAAGADIAFADQRPFHRLDYAAPKASHWCDPDIYNVTYDFARWPEWTAIWEVSGPRKSYVSTTCYRKQIT